MRDIEHSFMYIWQFQFGNEFTVIGRYWEEFLQMLKELTIFLEDNIYIVIFVHNLSHEFAFLKGVYNFKPEEVFCIKSHKILRCEMFSHFEFRCSYLHSNMKLEEFTKKMNVQHSKLSGEQFNYEKTRYPWTALTENEMQYCVNDVQGLVEAVQKEMELDGDNLYTYPLTSTGYVRREVKRTMKQYNHKQMVALQPDEKLYKALKDAFRGGNTHANRYSAGILLDDVSSADESSAYPCVLVNDLMPMKPFKEIRQKDLTREWVVEHLINKRKRAVLMRVRLVNVRLKNPFWGCPYLARSKCKRIDKHAVYDNGRVIEADYLVTCITDIDYKILCDEYEFDLIILSAWYSKYEPLPEMLRNLIISFYEKKTALKNVEGQKIYYDKSKAMINAIYGCMCQDVCKLPIIYCKDADSEFKLDETKTVEELLEQNRNRAFLFYAWACWCTSWARFRLERALKIAGDNFVYCDTDSIYYTGIIDWEEFNKPLIEQSKANGAVAEDKHGKSYYMGVFDYEGTKQFITLGAKKYAYMENGALKITVAGVNKKKGAEELTQKGGIENFKEGFQFIEGGGIEAVYNDKVDFYYKTENGREIHITDNLYLKPSTYTLGLRDDYRDIIKMAQKLIDMQEWRIDEF